jgi:hypothetical protein
MKHTEILGSFPSLADLARNMKIADAMPRDWKRNNSIPGKWRRRLENAARRMKVEHEGRPITVELLNETAKPRKRYGHGTKRAGK